MSLRSRYGRRTTYLPAVGSLTPDEERLLEGAHRTATGEVSHSPLPRNPMPTSRNPVNTRNTTTRPQNRSTVPAPNARTRSQPTISTSRGRSESSSSSPPSSTRIQPQSTVPASASTRSESELDEKTSDPRTDLRGLSVQLTTAKAYLEILTTVRQFNEYESTDAEMAAKISVQQAKIDILQTKMRQMTGQVKPTPRQESFREIFRKHRGRGP